MHRSVTIDGQIIELTPFDNNIVEMIKRANIKIPAPCYRTKRIKSCCSVCVVEIDGEWVLYRFLRKSEIPNVFYFALIPLPTKHYWQHCPLWTKT